MKSSKLQDLSVIDHQPLITGHRLPRHYRITALQQQRPPFTLIEVLMVCALLGFLMAIMVGGYSIAMTKHQS